MRTGFSPAPPCGSGDGDDDFAGLTRRESSSAGTRHSALTRRSIGSMRPVPPVAWLKDPDQAAGLIGEAAQGAAFEFAGPDRLELGQHALAGDERGLIAPLGPHEHQRGRAAAGPLDRAGDRLAIGVGAGDADDHGVGRARPGR